MGALSLSLFAQIKLRVSMPVTYLIWDALLSSPHLTSQRPTLTARYYKPVWYSLHLRKVKQRDEETDRRRNKRRMQLWNVLVFLSWILGLHVLILHLRLRSSKVAITSRVAKLIGHRLTCFGEKLISNCNIIICCISAESWAAKS